MSKTSIRDIEDMGVSMPFMSGFLDLRFEA